MLLGVNFGFKVFNHVKRIKNFNSGREPLKGQSVIICSAEIICTFDWINISIDNLGQKQWITHSTGLITFAPKLLICEIPSDRICSTLARYA